MLKPIVSYCLRRSITFQEFTQLARRLFAEVAAEMLERDGSAVSASRISVMTGLQRRDIQRLMGSDEISSSIPNLVTRIIGQWSTDKRFLDKRGKPRALNCRGKNSQFAQLVDLVTHDIDHTAVLYELARIDAIEKKGDLVRLTFQAYITNEDEHQGLEMLSSDVNDLITAVVENVTQSENPPNLHAKTEFDNISEEDIPQIRKWIIEMGQGLHEKIRNYLSRFDKDINPARSKKPGSVRVVVGTFSRTEIQCSRIARGENEN